jgi:four helix bundle suffix protein
MDCGLRRATSNSVPRGGSSSVDHPRNRPDDCPGSCSPDYLPRHSPDSSARYPPDSCPGCCPDCSVDCSADCRAGYSAGCLPGSSPNCSHGCLGSYLPDCPENHPSGSPPDCRACSPLDQQARRLDQAFLKKGGLRERMTRARRQERADQDPMHWAPARGARLPRQYQLPGRAPAVR